MTQMIQLAQTTEENFPKLKGKDGFDLVKVGSVSRNKTSVFLGRYCYVPSISIATLKGALGEMGNEASTILLEYFTNARNAYIRERIIEGLSELPETLLQFDHRNLWLAFNGVSLEVANIFIAQVIQTRCEEFAFNAAAKKLGFASLEEVPTEKEGEIIQIQATLLPTFIKAASSERNKEFLLSLVQEGRILSRYGKMSEAQCTEAAKWIAGVESPLTSQVQSLIQMRQKAIKDQIANLGVMTEELSVMAEYFKS